MDEKTAFEQDLNAILHHGEAQPLVRVPSRRRALKLALPALLVVTLTVAIGTMVTWTQKPDQPVAQAPAARTPVAQPIVEAERPIPSVVDLAVPDLQPSSAITKARAKARAPRRRVRDQRRRATQQHGRPVAYQPTAALAITSPREDQQEGEGTNHNDAQRRAQERVKKREDERLARLEALDAVRSLRLR